MKNIFKLLPYIIVVVLLVRAVFTDSITYDEPLHVASGIEWLTTGHSASDPFNPPLAKLPAVITQNIMALRFSSIFYTLTLIFLVYMWTKKKYGEKTGIIAAFLLATEPTVLAYGHLFTTDILATLLYFFIFMFPFFWPVLFAVKMTLLPMAIPFIFKSKFKLTVFAGLFSLLVFGLNFKELFNVFVHDFSYVFNPKFSITHTFMLFEQLSNTGWWYYPLIILPIKLSPILIIGIILGIKSVRPLILPIIFILGTVIIGRYNTGIRHLLPLFPFLAIIAAIGLARLNKKILISILIINLFLVIKINDYIAYFNPLIGSKLGGRIAVESNLDIGQSVYRAQKEVDFSKINYLVFNVYNGQKITGDIANKKILISRTLWYTAGYYLDPKFNTKKQSLVADDTLLLLE